MNCSSPRLLLGVLGALVTCCGCGTEVWSFGPMEDAGVVQPELDSGGDPLADAGSGSGADGLCDGAACSACDGNGDCPSSVHWPQCIASRCVTVCDDGGCSLGSSCSYVGGQVICQDSCEGGVCADCNYDFQCMPFSRVCVRGRCVECRTDSDCRNSCDPASGTCSPPRDF